MSLLQSRAETTACKSGGAAKHLNFICRRMSKRRASMTTAIPPQSTKAETTTDSANAMSDFSIDTRSYHGKTFEFFRDPPTICSHRDEAICLPYGIEVESRFAPRPSFAGGADPRNYVNVQIALGKETAAAIRSAEETFAAKTSFSGEWASSVVEKNGRHLFKCRIVVSASPYLTRFRYGTEGELRSGWPALEELLLHELRGANGRVAITPAKIWKVQGTVGCTWRVLQLDVESYFREE